MATSLPWPTGTFGVYADDDDVIGLKVAESYPHGYHVIRTEPPLMDAFDEFSVAMFLAWCLTNAERIRPLMEA